MSDALPIHMVLPDLIAALLDGPRAVLIAPPGAGKTTAVAPALINQPWCTGQILLLSPRRLAARAAAERMAELAGEAVGRTIGYATRMDSRSSADTRILVVTEGIFRARIQADPDLPGVSAVLFDEVHERSLDSDFGLALALDAQAGLREDLRIVAMSATLDGARFAALMDGAPVVESAGRSHPLDLRYVGRNTEAWIEDSMAAAIKRALSEETGGDLLAFLPGVAEIARTAERIEGLAGVMVHPLHGSLDPAAQRAALRPDNAGRRKIILATSIAETSLTINGVRIVVDSGLARRPRYDRAAGVTRLVTERVSQAAATQRAGRAARQGPGVAYRLWEAAATAGLPPFDPPEILESDLSSLLLDCAIWGVTDPATLRWLDPPPAAALAEARTRLTAIGGLDEAGHATPHGRAMARLPMEPRLAHMMIRAADLGIGHVAADVAVLMGERGIGGDSTDITLRRARWRQERGARADAARSLSVRWAKLIAVTANNAGDDHDVARCLALAFPDRVAKRRDPSGEQWISVGGRGYRLDPTSPLARADWLAVGAVQGSAAGARILSAAPLTEGDVLALFPERIGDRRAVSFRRDIAGVDARRERTLGAIRLSSGDDDDPDRASVVAALAEGLRAHGLSLLPWGDRAVALRQRAAFAGEAMLDDDALLADAQAWLDVVMPPRGRRFAAIPPAALHQMLDNRLGWDARQRIDRLAPESFTSPAGSSHPIDYAAEAGPTVELRVQALFGLAQHPVIGQRRVPLVLSLTSPAGRPIQTTRDLPGFWAGSWADVAKEMRGRYPRHPWPDDPAGAAATLRTKNADARRRS